MPLEGDAERPVFKGFGRPLWHYSSDLELLKGLLAALDAHESLTDLGIEYHHIGEESIMLSGNSTSVEGCVAAYLVDAESLDMTNSKMALKAVDTYQFMAVHVLDAIGIQPAIVQTSEHDVESFVWLLAYSVMRKLYGKAIGDERYIMGQKFLQSFGKSSVSEISSQRSARTPLTWPKFVLLDDLVHREMSEVLRGLFLQLRAQLAERDTIRALLEIGCKRVGVKEIVLTHAWLRGFLLRAIAGLEGAAARDTESNEE